MAKQIKVRFGQGDIVLTKSTKFVGVRKSEFDTRDLMAESQLDPEIKKVVHPNLGGFEIVTVNKQKSEKLDEKKVVMRALAEVETVTNVYHVPGSEKPLVPTGSIYIQFANGVSEETQKSILDSLYLALKERRNDTKVVAQCTPQSKNPVTCAIELGEKKEVKWAEPDMDSTVEHYAYANPTARLMGQMWHLQNAGRIPDNPNIRIKPGADAKVVEAWKILDGYGNPNIVVAVIDNGFDISHPDLNTKVVRPWDLWNGSPQLRAGDPTFTHGTPCAGVAIAPPTGGMVGSAPVARFMPISGTGFSIESTEAMFNYVIRNGADVVSCSWGTVENGFQLSSDKIAAISKAAREGRGGKGCVICYAAGNEGVDYLNFYAQHPDVICVGASTSEDEHADYSNMGAQLDVVAPSNGGYYPIVSARAYWDEGIPGEVGANKWYYGDGIDRGSRYQHFGGTSSATPLVAGICALVLSANPNLTAREVKEIIRMTADKIGSPSEYYNGRSVKYGFGRINAAKAVTEALRRAGKTTTSTPTTPTTTPTVTPSVPSQNPPQGTGLFRYGTNARIANKGFSVQAGSFNQWASVRSTAPGLETKFKQPALVHVAGSTPTTMMYRILLGQFNTLGDANRFLATLKAAGIAGFVRDLSGLT
ncbi:MAG: S8 family serine peptidase [Saprospiraceae bacterium]|nr:S8 family serine peptidase [Saprospiraceae bacterium]